MTESSSTELTPLTVRVAVRASLQQAWEAFTRPASITAWNFASPEWQCPRAENDLRGGGRFCYRMEARDGSFGFDFEGRFTEVLAPTRLRYTLGPDREVVVEFARDDDHTVVTQTFTPDATYPLEQQRAGWQAILENYKSHVESKVTVS